MRDAFIARYGHQDIRYLRGSTEPLSDLDKYLFAFALKEHLDAEYADNPSRNET